MAKKTEDTGFSEIDKLLDKEFDDLINLSKTDNKINNWLSWGNYALNYISSKNLRSGVPCGRITSISGLSSSGKSLLSANLMKDPKIDMILIIETEGSNSQELIEFAGVDPSKVRLIRGSTFKSYKVSKKSGKIEEISDAELPVNKDTDLYIYTEGLTSKLKRFVNTIEFNKVKKNILVVLDSLANVMSVRALNGTPDMGKRAGEINSFFQTFDIALERTNIAFVFTNKLYTDLNAYGGGYTEAGGVSAVYNSSLSLRLSTVNDSSELSDAEIKEEKERRKTALGNSLKVAKVKITKSRFGTEGRNSSFIIDLNYGIIKLSGLFNLLLDFGVITSPSSGWYETSCIKDRFRKKDFYNIISKDEDKYIDVFQKELEKAEEIIKKNKLEKLESGKVDVSDSEKIEFNGEEIDENSMIAMEREMIKETEKE